jgi:hypothetical protein
MCAQASDDGGVVAIRNGVGFVEFGNCTVANIRVRALPAAALPAAAVSGTDSFRFALRALSSAWQCCARLLRLPGFLFFWCFIPCTQPPQCAAQSTVSACTPRQHLTWPLPGIGAGGLVASLRASGMQANGEGGLVGIISCGTTGHVSVVGSTLTNITVCAHC